MNATQVILSLVVVSVILVLLSRFHSQLFDRCIVIIIGVGCLTVVVVPDLSTVVKS